MLNLLPYALAAYGGYKGYQGAKESGASGIGRLLGAAGGAYGGYQLGATGMNLTNQQFTPYSQLGQQYSFLSGLPGQQGPAVIGTDKFGRAIENRALQSKGDQGGSLLDILRK